jgi:hypothetical protein
MGSITKYRLIPKFRAVIKELVQAELVKSDLRVPKLVLKIKLVALPPIGYNRVFLSFPISSKEVLNLQVATVIRSFYQVELKLLFKINKI